MSIICLAGGFSNPFPDDFDEPEAEPTVTTAKKSLTVNESSFFAPSQPSSQTRAPLNSTVISQSSQSHQQRIQGRYDVSIIPFISILLIQPFYQCFVF